MAKSILEQIRERESEKFDLHERYLNAQHVRVLKTIGFDRHYVRANGAYLYDDKGDQYLDLLSGFGVFAVGRNYLDATPTSGTIFVGGGGETLSVEVTVEPHQPRNLLVT